MTNHNVFDSSQFIQIQKEVACQVFPGIEVDLQSGHLLVISSGDNLADFDSKCKKVSAEIITETDSISTQGSRVRSCLLNRESKRQDLTPFS